MATDAVGAAEQWFRVRDEIEDLQARILFGPMAQSLLDIGRHERPHEEHAFGVRRQLRQREGLSQVGAVLPAPDGAEHQSFAGFRAGGDNLGIFPEAADGRLRVSR